MKPRGILWGARNGTRTRTTAMVKGVPGTGLEPVRPQWSRDFKSLVSTNSTIWAALSGDKITIKSEK